MITALGQVDQLETAVKMKLYIYIDGNFVYKTKTYQESKRPDINLEIDM